MFYGVPKKIKFYLDKNLARKISDDCIQLTFTPNGPGCLDAFRSQKRENHCVVCGKENCLTCHHVVPFCYRRELCKAFPNYEIDFHDCLAVCIDCHKKYEQKHAVKLYKVVESLFGVPLGGIINGTTFQEIQRFNLNIQWAKTLLKYKDSIPLKRQEEMRQKLSNVFPDYAKHSLEELEELYLDKDSFDYRSHGELVIEKVVAQNTQDGFVQTWRKHFLETMQPRFLPKFWEVKRPVFKTRQELDDYR